MTCGYAHPSGSIKSLRDSQGDHGKRRCVNRTLNFSPFHTYVNPPVSGASGAPLAGRGDGLGDAKPRSIPDR